MNFDRLTAYLDSLYEKEGIPSSQMVVHKDGREIYRHSAGYRDVAAGEKITPDAMYFMYSVSKVVTAVAGMQLLERGVLRAQESVSRYLPEFKGSGIRVFHLFTMTSGLTYDTGTEPIRRCIAEHNGAPSTADVVRAIAASPRAFLPGKHWKYSLSHDVLARVIEVASGERFSAYVQKNIFDPVGMTHSTYHLTDAVLPKMAGQYRFDNELGKAVPIALNNGLVFGPEYESGGAGVISCLDDLILLADTLTRKGVTPDGKRILSERTVDLMRTDCLDANTRPDYNWDFLAGYGYGYGVRTLVAPQFGGTLSSVGEFGWGGAAGSYFHADPAAGVSIVYVQHMLNNKEGIVHPRLRNLVYAEL